MRHDGFVQVDLPDANGDDIIAGRGDQTATRDEHADRRAEIAAVAGPIDRRLADRHDAEAVIDIEAGPVGAGNQRDLAGAGGRAAETVDLGAVVVGAAESAQQQGIAPHRIGGIEKQVLAAAAAHPGGG